MKIKLYNYFLVLIASFSLVLSSCNNIASDDYEENKNQGTSVSTETVSELDSEGVIAYLTVAIDSLSEDGVSSRTVLPDFTDSDYKYTGFDKFELTGAYDGKNYKIAEWTSDSDGLSAYEKLVGKTTTTGSDDEAVTTTNGDYQIPLTLFSKDETATETWSFTLTAYHHYVENEATTTVFKGTTSKNIVAGANNSLAFSLTRDSEYKFAAASENKAGSLSITLNYVTGARTEVQLFKCDASTGEHDGNDIASSYWEGESDRIFTVANGAKKELSIASIPEGFYELILNFTNNDIAVGVMKEYVYILQDLTSVKTIKVDVNADYAITYFYKILDVDGKNEITYIKNDDSYGVKIANFFKGTDNKPYHGDIQAMYYSRLNTVTLPQETDFVDTFNSKAESGNEYLFCGWYEDEGFTKGPILNIKKNSTVGDKTYYGKFIDKREKPEITSVVLTADTKTADADDFKVGHKITATAKTDAGDFAGTVQEWKWYKVKTDDDPADAQITENIDNPAKAQTTDLVTTSSYSVRPIYAGKNIKVTATKKYTVRSYDDKDNESGQSYVYNAGYVRTTYTAANYNAAGLYKVVEFKENPTDTEVTYGYPSPKVSNETGQFIGKGNLAVTTAAFKLYYEYTSETDGSTETTKINTNLRDDGLAEPFATILSAVHDANTTGWTLNDTTVFVDTNADSKYYSIAFNTASQKAPTASGYVPVKISVDGYNDLVLGTTGDVADTDYDDIYSNGAFIKVRYDNPMEREVLNALWKDGDVSDQNVRDGFDKQTISFKDTAYSKTYDGGTISVPLIWSEASEGTFASPVARLQDDLGKENGSSEISVGTSKTLYFKATETPATENNGDSKNADWYGKVWPSTDTARDVTFTWNDTESSTDANNNYIGRRISIASLRISGTTVTDATGAEENADKVYTAKIGDTLTIVPLDSTGAEITSYSDIVWTIKRNGTAISGLTGLSDENKAAYTGYRLIQKDYVSEDAHTAGKQLKVTATRTYAFSKELSKAVYITVEKGSLKLDGFSVTWNPTDDNPTLEVGTQGTADNITWKTGEDGGAVDGTYTPENSDPADKVEVSSVVFSGDVNASGEAQLKVSALGYEDAYSKQLENIPLRYTIGETEVKLSADKPNISYRSILFDLESAAPGRTASSYEYILTAPTGTGTGGSITTNDWANYAPASNGWTELPADEFADPFFGNAGTAGTIYVRVKADATSGYYASTPIEVSYEKADNAGSRGVSGFTVTFETLAEADIKMTESSVAKNTTAGTITIAAPSDLSTIKFWRINGKNPVSYYGSEAVSIDTEHKTLTITTAEIGSGVYNVTVVGSKTSVSGVTYSAGITVVVSE